MEPVSKDIDTSTIKFAKPNRKSTQAQLRLRFDKAMRDKMQRGSNVFMTSTIGNQPLTFPKIAPEKAVDMYMMSLRNKEDNVELPVYRDDYGPYFLELVRSWRSMEEREEWLKNARKTIDRRRAEMDQQWKELTQKETGLRQAFLKFNSFVKENEEKRMRSKQRIAYLKDTVRSRIDEIEKLREQYDAALRAKALMETKVRQFSMYEDYLNAVIAVDNGDFRHPQDFILRYEALMEAKSVIKEKQERTYRLIEDVQLKLRKTAEDSQMKLMGLLNAVNDSMQRYEHAKFKAMKWEAIVYLVHEYSKKLQSRIIKTRGACLNIYKDCCRRKNVKKIVPDNDTRRQLIFIKKAMKDLQDITDLFRAHGVYSTVL